MTEPTQIRMGYAVWSNCPRMYTALSIIRKIFFLFFQLSVHLVGFFLDVLLRLCFVHYTGKLRSSEYSILFLKSLDRFPGASDSASSRDDLSDFAFTYQVMETQHVMPPFRWLLNMCRWLQSNRLAKRRKIKLLMIVTSNDDDDDDVISHTRQGVCSIENGHVSWEKSN